MDWVIQNKEWLFSGIGVVFVSAIAGLFFKSKGKRVNQSINSGNNSINIQSGKDIQVHIGDKNAKR